MKTVNKPCRKCNEVPLEEAREAKRQEYMQHGEAIANMMADYVTQSTATDHEVVEMGDDLTFAEFRCLKCGYYTKNERARAAMKELQDKTFRPAPIDKAKAAKTRKRGSSGFRVRKGF